MKRTFYIGATESDIINVIESSGVSLDDIGECMSGGLYMHALDDLDCVVDAVKVTLSGDGRKLKRIVNFFIRSFGRFCDETECHLF